MEIIPTVIQVDRHIEGGYDTYDIMKISLEQIENELKKRFCLNPFENRLTYVIMHCPFLKLEWLYVTDDFDEFRADVRKGIYDSIEELFVNWNYYLRIGNNNLIFKKEFTDFYNLNNAKIQSLVEAYGFNRNDDMDDDM